MRILITGASGSGTTTLGRALAAQLQARFLDADDYYWLATDPPFVSKRDPDSRLTLLSNDLHSAPSVIVAGSLLNWGGALEDGFSLIVFLTLDAAIRVSRLRARELAVLGRIDTEFLAWAEQYDSGQLPGRSRARHELWLSQRRCPVLRMDGDLTVPERMACVLKAINDAQAK